MCEQKRKKGILFSVALAILSVSFLYLFPSHTNAATGINAELSFEGKIVTAAGINIPDGTYNMEFTIYTGCTNNTGTGCTAAWTEDYLDTGTNTGGVPFTSGTFQTNLGSICAFSGGSCETYTNTPINWNTYPLYLSIQIGNNSACTVSTNFHSNCSGDGVMSPYILLTSTPYSMNSNELGGLTSASYGQLASTQTWTGANTLQPTTNITGAVVQQTSVASPTADIFDVQTANASKVIQVTGPSANNAAVLITSIGGSSGLTLQAGSGTVSLGTSTALTANGSLNVSANGASTLTLDTTGAGIVDVGANATTVSVGSGTVADTINVGNSSGGNTVNLSATAGTNNVNIGSSAEPVSNFDAYASTIAIGTGTNADTINIGNSTGGNTISLGNGAGANVDTVNIGSAANPVNNFNAYGNTLIDTPTNSGTAFQVQDANGAPVLLVDTTSTAANGSQLNYLGYPGFESGSFTNASAGWAGVSPGTLTQNSSKQNTYNGLYSAKVATTASNGGLTTSSFVSSPPTGTYIVSFYAEVGSGATNIASNNFVVTATPGNGTTNICSPVSGTTINSSGFQRLYCTVVTNGAMTALQITQNDGIARTNGIFIDAAQVQSNSFNGSTITLPTAYQIGGIQLRGVIENPVSIFPNADSTSVFQVSNAEGTVNLINADTLDSIVSIAGAQPAAVASVAGTNAANILNVTGSAGGAVTAGAFTGGSGAGINLTSGAGGASFSTAVNSNGGAITIQGGAAGTGGSGTAGAIGAISLNASGGNVTIGTSGATAASTTANIATSTGATQTVNIGATGSGTAAVGTTVNIQGGTGASAIVIQSEAASTIGIGTGNFANTLQLGSTTLSSGTETVNLGTNNTSGGTTNVTVGSGSTATAGTTTIQGKGLVTLQSSGAGVTIDTSAAGQTTQIDNSAVTHTLNIATAAAVQTVAIGSSNSTSKLTLNAGINSTTSGVGVVIGSATASANQINLQLDTYNGTETASTCTAVLNQGAMYYSSVSNSIRACVGTNAWTEVVTGDELGLQLFGVVDDSANATNPGDLASIVTAGSSGPCKVFLASTTTISWNACTAYSGGRKVIVTAAAAQALTLTSGWDHICLTTASTRQPTWTNGSTEVASLGTISYASATAPILCLADVSVSGTAITGIYDTRTFVSARKAFATVGTINPALGDIVISTTTSGVSTVSAAATAAQPKVQGVVVASTGAASATTVNAIIAVNGPAWVKGSAGTVNQYVETTAAGTTAGYADTTATAPAPTGGAYATLGVANTTWSNTCSAVTNCSGSIFTYLNIR
jgi:hypothetical protein